MAESARQQKNLFAIRVRSIVGERAITMIGEEFDEGIVTIASLTVPNWKMIDMPRAVRQQRNIPAEYTDPDRFAEEQRISWNHEREQYMFDYLSHHTDPEDSVLIICGSDHIAGLMRLFGQAGLDPTSEDVTESEWFDPPP